MIVLCLCFAHKYGIHFQSQAQAQNMYTSICYELSVYLVIFDVITGSISFWHLLIQPFVGISKAPLPRSFAADMRICCAKRRPNVFFLAFCLIHVCTTNTLNWYLFIYLPNFCTGFIVFAVHLFLFILVIYVRRAVKVHEKVNIMFRVKMTLPTPRLHHYIASFRQKFGNKTCTPFPNHCSAI